MSRPLSVAASEAHLTTRAAIVDIQDSLMSLWNLNERTGPIARHPPGDDNRGSAELLDALNDKRQI